MATKHEASSSAKLPAGTGPRSSPTAAKVSASSRSDEHATANVRPISAAEFDRKFDAGEDIDEYIDWSSARRPGLEPKRVNVDFPIWMVQRLDVQAQKRGVTRQALIKMWLADRLETAG